MISLNVDLAKRSYPIYIGNGLINQPELLCQHLNAQQVMVVTNTTVADLYLSTLLSHLSAYRVATAILPDGETYKNLTQLNTIFDALLKHKFSRNAAIIALGGGVIGDMAGFAAACYQRGIAYLQIPTTLLAQVDSSVGGKTGVNHALGKNMIGAFHQPRCVIIDTEVLNTLSNRELAAGLAEIIKYGLIRDAEFFAWLEANISQLVAREPSALAYAIHKSCATKAAIVGEDETESSVRATLNLGHTFGHAIETGSGYGTYLHGEAVAIGMCLAADLSRRLGWLNDRDVERIIRLLEQAKLPTRPPLALDTEQFMELMSVDKKNLDGKIRLILMHRIGACTLPISVDHEPLKLTLQHYGRA